MLVRLVTTINFMKSINTLASFKLNYRTVLKKQPVGMNSLKGNYGKYGSMLMSRVNKLKDHKLKLNVNGTDIKSYDSITLLGVDIDNALNFSGHISNICKKSSQHVGLINRLRNLIPQNARVQLFKGAILPHLTYCSTVWNFCKASDSRKLERVQERTLRAIYCESNSTYLELLQRAKLPTLYNRRLQDIAILMYKVKNGLCPDYIFRLFIIRSNQYNLRNNSFIIPRVNTTGYGEHSVRYLGPVLWSKIDRKFRELKTVDQFKRVIRKVDLAKCILVNNWDHVYFVHPSTESCLTVGQRVDQ